MSGRKLKVDRHIGTGLALLALLSQPAAAADDDAALLREVAARGCDAALPRLRERFRDHRGADAPPALGRVMLDCLNQAQDLDTMAEVVADLRGPAAAPRAVGDFAAELARIDLALRRRAAEELLRRGEHAQAGEAFLSLARSASEPRLRFESAYNAAAAFTWTRSAGLAQEALLLARRSASGPAEVRMALQRLAPAYRATTDFAEAAATYEDLGRGAAPGGDREGMEALSNAAMLRAVLGQAAPLRTDVQLFAQRFGGPRATAEAAGLFLSLTPLLPEAEARDHLRAYLRLFGQAGGRVRTFTARAHLGRLALDASCPQAEDGLCVARVPLSPAEVARLGCGPPRRYRVVVKQRTPALSREAEAHLRGVLALTPGASGEPPEDGAGQAAAATVMLGDLEFERLLATPPPTGIVDIAGPPRERQAALRRVAAWAGQLMPRFEAVQRRYQAALAAGHPAWAVASLARLGQLHAALANRLVTLPVPPPFRDPEIQRAYCAALEEVSQPAQARAEEAFTACLARGADLGVPSAWSSLCERELHRLDPRRHPIPGEITAAPVLAPLVLDRAPIVQQTKGGPG
jgi:hypothetical protein